jgi:ADP-ribose pyrophosphatase YjhB (NUDIX family)
MSPKIFTIYKKKIKLFNRVAAIVVRDGYVLTHEALHDDGLPYQALPGGRLEPEETATECLVREFEEEFGAALVVDHLLYVAEGFWCERGKQLHEVVLYFVAHLVDPNAEIQSLEKKISARWLPIEGGLDRLFPEWLRQELPRRAEEGWDEPVRYIVAQE